jgi:hypothetical protein
MLYRISFIRRAADKIRGQMKKCDPHATEVAVKSVGWGN